MQSHDRSKWPVVPGSLGSNWKARSILLWKIYAILARMCFFFNLRYCDLTRMCFLKKKTRHFNANVLIVTKFFTQYDGNPMKIACSLYFSPRNWIFTRKPKSTEMSHWIHSHEQSWSCHHHHILSRWARVVAIGFPNRFQRNRIESNGDSPRSFATCPTCRDPPRKLPRTNVGRVTELLSLSHEDRGLVKKAQSNRLSNPGLLAL